MFFIESSGQIFHYYKLQTCHPSQHFKRLLRKSQRVGQLRNLHTPIGIVTSLYYSHSLGEFIPGLLSHLSLSLSSKASPPHLWPPGCFFPKKLFHLQEIHHQLTAECVYFLSRWPKLWEGVSFVLPPTEGIKHKVTLPISL